MEQLVSSQVLVQNEPLSGHWQSGISDCPEEFTTDSGDVLSESHDMSYCRELLKENPNDVQLHSARQQLRELREHVKAMHETPIQFITRKAREKQLRILIKSLEAPELASFRKMQQNIRAHRSRSLRLANETPEEAAARRAKKAEEMRFCRAMHKALETPEEEERRKFQQRIRARRARMKKKFGMAVGGAMAIVSTELNSSNSSTETTGEQQIVRQKKKQHVLTSHETNGHGAIWQKIPELLQNELLHQNFSNHQNLATIPKHSILEDLLLQPRKTEPSLRYTVPKRPLKAVPAIAANTIDSQTCDSPSEVPFYEEFQQHLNSPSASSDLVSDGVCNSAIANNISNPVDIEALRRARHAARMRLVRAIAKQNETPEQAARRRQQARIRAQRARERRRAARFGNLEDGTSCSSFEQNDKNCDSSKEPVSKCEFNGQVSAVPRSTDHSTPVCIKVKKFAIPEEDEKRGSLTQIQDLRTRKATGTQINASHDGACSFPPNQSGNTNWGESSYEKSFNEFNTKVKQEFGTENYDLAENRIHPVIEMNPLHVNTLIKEEPCDLNDNNPMEDALVSDFLAIEMKRMKHASEIVSGENVDQKILKGIYQADREIIDENESLPSDVKPTAEELSAYATKVSDIGAWNTLEGHRELTPCEGVPVTGALIDRKVYKRALQAERMRRHRVKRKQLETPEQASKRRENQRLRAERARLKKKALQAGILVEFDPTKRSKLDHDLDGNNGQDYTIRGTHAAVKSTTTSGEAQIVGDGEHVESRLWQTLQAMEKLNSCTSLVSRESFPSFGIECKEKSRSKLEEALLAERSSEVNAQSVLSRKIARSVETPEEAELRKLNQRLRKRRSREKQRLGDLQNAELSCESMNSQDSQRGRWAEKVRERRSNETPEETDTRRPKQGIVGMKSQLTVSEEQLKVKTARVALEMCGVRQKRRETDSTEETTDREQKLALQTRKSRGRLQSSETPEERL